jgi:hypothetical protein
LIETNFYNYSQVDECEEDTSTPSPTTAVPQVKGIDLIGCCQVLKIVSIDDEGLDSTTIGLIIGGGICCLLIVAGIVFFLVR